MMHVLRAMQGAVAEKARMMGLQPNLVPSPLGRRLG